MHFLHTSVTIELIFYFLWKPLAPGPEGSAETMCNVLAQLEKGAGILPPCGLLLPQQRIKKLPGSAWGQLAL